MNIYMNELDKAVRAVGEWFSAGSDGRNKVNNRYAALRSSITALDRKIAGAEGPCRRALLDERRSIKKQLRRTPSYIPTMKKICYVRYADYTEVETMPKNSLRCPAYEDFQLKTSA